LVVSCEACPSARFPFNSRVISTPEEPICVFFFLPCPPRTDHTREELLSIRPRAFPHLPHRQIAIFILSFSSSWSGRQPQAPRAIPSPFGHVFSRIASSSPVSSPDLSPCRRAWFAQPPSGRAAHAFVVAKARPSASTKMVALLARTAQRECTNVTFPLRAWLISTARLLLAMGIPTVQRATASRPPAPAPLNPDSPWWALVPPGTSWPRPKSEFPACNFLRLACPPCASHSACTTLFFFRPPVLVHCAYRQPPAQAAVALFLPAPHLSPHYGPYSWLGTLQIHTRLLPSSEPPAACHIFPSLFARQHMAPSYISAAAHQCYPFSHANELLVWGMGQHPPVLEPAVCQPVSHRRAFNAILSLMNLLFDPV
jgi:hypothetical protein